MDVQNKARPLTVTTVLHLVAHGPVPLHSDPPFVSVLGTPKSLKRFRHADEGPTTVGSSHSRGGTRLKTTGSRVLIRPQTAFYLLWTVCYSTSKVIVEFDS